MKKGFTLVELLAVIVILAIILVIVMPRISDVLNKSKEKTFESNINEVLSIVKMHYQSNYSGKLSDTKVIYNIANHQIIENEVKIDYAKNIDLTGIIEIDSDGEYKIKLSNESYCGIKDFNDILNVYKINNELCN